MKVTKIEERICGTVVQRTTTIREGTRDEVEPVVVTITPPEPIRFPQDWGALYDPKAPKEILWVSASDERTRDHDADSSRYMGADWTPGFGLATGGGFAAHGARTGRDNHGEAWSTYKERFACMSPEYIRNMLNRKLTRTPDLSAVIVRVTKPAKSKTRTKPKARARKRR